MEIITGPAAAGRHAAMPALPGAGSCGWQVAGIPVQVSLKSQSLLPRQMHSIPLLQNGASGLHPVLDEHTRQLPWPPLAAVSQTGVGAEQSAALTHPHTLSARQ